MVLVHKFNFINNRYIRTTVLWDKDTGPLLIHTPSTLVARASNGPGSIEIRCNANYYITYG